MRHRWLWAWTAIVAAVVGVAGCGGSAGGSGGSASPAAAHLSAPSARVGRLLHWRRYVHIDRVLDVAGPRSDGSLVVAAAGRLWLLPPSGRIEQYPGSYLSPGGEEPYIALAAAGPGCSFHPGTVYALRLRPPRGVVGISPSGQVRQFARIDAPGLIDGIAFDRTGRFGRRLLVTVNAGRRSTVVAIDCHGAVTTITRSAPRVEGGIAVAPAGFGRFGGDLIAPDETGGRIFAVAPSGKTVLLAFSRLPHGPDIGVESEGFVPQGTGLDAVVADRLTPGNRHPGDDFMLRIRAATLAGAGVHPGDLLIVTEGGARTDAVHCGPAACHVRHLANGPPEAHAEGHVAFAATAP